MISITAQDVLAVVRAEQERTSRQLESLQCAVAAIVEASELTSTDDEHDPEGATIAYERAQALALLRQAGDDLAVLAGARQRLEAGQAVTCIDCDHAIALERLAALPTARRCIRCAA